MSTPKALRERCQKDPAFFFNEVLGCDLWPRQIEIAESVRDNSETAVPACHASGKTHVAGRIVPWFLYSHPRSIVITTAPTERQVKLQLWKEISAAHGNSKYPLGGKLTTMNLQLDDARKDWYAVGFTAREFDPDKFQGFHAPYILVIEDEASGIASSISEQIETLLSSGHARRLKIGNPVDPFSAFKRSCEDVDVTTLPISAFDTPNFTEFGINMEDLVDGSWEEKVSGELPRPELITPQWAALMVRRYGPTSPFVIARVKGEFPTEVEGAFYAKEMTQARDDGRIGVVPIEPGLRTYTAWDLGHDDATAIWWIQVANREIHWVDYYENRGRKIAHYVSKVNEWRDRHDVAYEAHFGPHDLEQVHMVNSVLETAEELGLRFTVVPKINRLVPDGVDLVRNILPRSWFDKVRCEKGINGLSAYHAEEDPKTEENRPQPVHDWCLTGDTEVLTRHGTHPIMDLPDTGEVLTECGWRPYRNPRITRRDAPLVGVEFSDGLTVRCTPEHRFATEFGWRSAESLRPNSLIQSCSTPSSSTSMVGSIGYGRQKPTSLEVAKRCIVASGRLLLERFLRAITSTISTVIPQTTPLVTLSAFPPQSTCQTLGERIEPARRSISRTMPEKQLRPGTGPTLAGCGINATPSNPSRGTSGSGSSRAAKLVGMRLWRFRGRMGTRRSTADRSADPLRIVDVRPLAGREDVWCLTVPSTHSFALANGVLSHNSSHPADAARQFAQGYDDDAGWTDDGSAAMAEAEKWVV